MRNPYQPTQHARDALDPESSDSDVSVGGGDEYRALTAPLPLPPQPSKHALESSDGVQHRLDQLTKVEEMNIRKYDLLKAKRKRKDDRIRQKREIQDRKWAAITDARRRRDLRIETRRKREDAAFTQFFEHELEDEENNLRKRLKRLKRGLPPDDSPQPGNARIASASMSPPGTGLSTLPPPPKRHQVAPPGQIDSTSTHSRVADQGTLPPPQPPKNTGPNQPYNFYRNSESSYTRQFQQSSSYSTTPTSGSPAGPTNGLNQSTQISSDRTSLSQLTRSDSSHTNRATPSSQSPATPATGHNPLTRPSSSSYDTRPPPATTSSGFASVNAPVSSGFATINPRSVAPLPAPHANSHIGSTRPTSDIDTHKTPVQHSVAGGIDNSRFHPYNSATTGSPSATSTNSANKRTPSTTHPYQMSEAFANRHHHCERVDILNRGIWTSYGVGGTQENPTGPPTEMYLRCNHDGCSRIDWRTVHGLQCHIVKNHEQPKGTIGSLDKALEKYGVPVKEVEKYESEHGNGSAGTVADPKNHKIKVKTKEQLNYAGKTTPTSHGVDLQTRPAGWRPSPTPGGSPPLSEEVKRSPLSNYTNGFGKEVLVPNRDGPAKTNPPPITASPSINTFSSITGTHVRSEHRSDWLGRTMPSSSASRIEPESKRLQGDVGASNNLPSTRDLAPPSLTNPSPPSHPPVSGEARQLVSSPNLTAKITPAAVDSNPTTSSSLPAATTTSASGSGDFPTKAVEPKQEVEVPTPGAPSIPSQVEHGVGPKDGDVKMTGTDEGDHKLELQTNGGAEPQEKTKEEGATNGRGQITEDQSETIVVDGDANKAASSIESSSNKRAPLQSPTISTKTLPANTPGSNARRLSRRSSAARQSVEDSDTSYMRDGRSGTTNGDDEKDEKDSKDGREKTPPRRILRRTRA